MEKQEFINQSKELYEKYMLDLRLLRTKYVMANNPYSPGDVISDHRGVYIRIETIGTWHDSDNPCCLYKGPRVKKDGTPYKNGGTETIYQSNINR